MSIRSLRLLLPFALVLFFSPLLAGTVVLEPAKDNTLYESASGAKSNGAGQYLFAGRTLEREDALRRALIAFDIASAVPSGSRIMAVRLRLVVSRTIVGAVPVSLHRLLADWGEGASDAPREEGDGAPAEPGDATWVHRFFDTVPWRTPGGDFESRPSATALVGLNGAYEWGPTEAMREDVQRWLDDPGSNHGWILIADETQVPTAKRFDAREHPVPANRPSLVVEFEPPVPMARFLPLVTSLRFRAPGRDRFSAAGLFELGEGSDGIDPATEEVVVRFGTFSETLPAGAFQCRSGVCLYAHEPPGLTRVLLEGDRFAVEGAGLDLAGTANPVPLSLTIGNDVGDAEARLSGTLRGAPRAVGGQPAEVRRLRPAR